MVESLITTCPRPAPSTTSPSRSPTAAGSSIQSGPAAHEPPPPLVQPAALDRLQNAARRGAQGVAVHVDQVAVGAPDALDEARQRVGRVQARDASSTTSAAPAATRQRYATPAVAGSMCSKWPTRPAPPARTIAGRGRGGVVAAGELGGTTSVVEPLHQQRRAAPAAAARSARPARTGRSRPPSSRSTWPPQTPSREASRRSRMPACETVATTFGSDAAHTASWPPAEWPTVTTGPSMAATASATSSNVCGQPPPPSRPNLRYSRLWTANPGAAVVARDRRIRLRP